MSVTEVLNGGWSGALGGGATAAPPVGDGQGTPLLLEPPRQAARDAPEPAAEASPATAAPPVTVAPSVTVAPPGSEAAGRAAPGGAFEAELESGASGGAAIEQAAADIVNALVRLEPDQAAQFEAALKALSDQIPPARDDDKPLEEVRRALNALQAVAAAPPEPSRETTPGAVPAEADLRTPAVDRDAPEKLAAQEAAQGYGRALAPADAASATRILGAA